MEKRHEKNGQFAHGQAAVNLHSRLEGDETGQPVNCYK
jgi:hypothetical protein